MMSQTAPAIETHPEADQVGTEKDEAFVSFYNEADLSQYLYTTPAFASGFLPLEPLDEKPTTSTTTTIQPVAIKPTRRPTETFNTGTTPPQVHASVAGTNSTAKVMPTPLKSSIKAASNSASSPDHTAATQAPTAKVVERRPSFVEVTFPQVHGHGHGHEHHGHQSRRHSSESHLPLSWWPEPEEKAQHEWVEADQEKPDEDKPDQDSADEEEDAIEEAFYASYDD